MVIYVRIFELAVELTLLSANLYEKVAKPVIALAFSDFFEMNDLLSQISIMDFVVKLSESPISVASLSESNFIDRLFAHFGNPESNAYGFINSNMLMVGAKIYSVNPSLFNPFENPNYMEMLRGYLTQSVDQDKLHLKDIGIQCLYFIFKQKQHCLKKYML